MTTVARYAKDMGGLILAEDFVIEEMRYGHLGLMAIVNVDGERVPVTRRFGCWGTVPDDSGWWRTVLPEYAVALQQAARRLT